MIRAILNLIKPDKSAQDANEWRFGCLTAVAVRMFPDQEGIGMSVRDRQQRIEESPSFRAGWLYGLDMALAYSLPDQIPPTDRCNRLDHTGRQD